MKKIFAALILTVCASMGYAADFYGNYGYGGGTGCPSGRCVGGQCPGQIDTVMPIQPSQGYYQGGQGYFGGQSYQSSYYPQGQYQSLPQGPYQSQYQYDYNQPLYQGRGYQFDGQPTLYQGRGYQYDGGMQPIQPMQYQGRYQGQDFRSGQTFQGQGAQSYSTQRFQGSTQQGNVQGQKSYPSTSSSYAPPSSNY